MSGSPLDPLRIRRNMLRYEESDGVRTVAQTVAEALGVAEPGEPIDGPFLAALQREVDRSVTLMEAHYQNDRGRATPRTFAAIGFCQGVLFTVAVRDIIDAVGEAHK